MKEILTKNELLEIKFALSDRLIKKYELINALINEDTPGNNDRLIDDIRVDFNDIKLAIGKINDLLK